MEENVDSNPLQPKEETYGDKLSRAFQRPISMAEEKDFAFKLEHRLCYICGKTGKVENGLFWICNQHEKALRKHFDRNKRKRIPIVAEKIGRNEQCHCGSGKKYKYCCLK
jgi:preprotein translocase subunit SecA